MNKPRKPDILAQILRRGDGFSDTFWWIVTMPIMLVTGVIAYLVYAIQYGVWLVVEYVIPEPISTGTAALVSAYGATVIGVVIVLGIGYFIYDDVTSDPCGDDKERVRAYEITLFIPEAPEEPYENRAAWDAWFQSLDRIEARYPELYDEYESAQESLSFCLDEEAAKNEP